jgi:hypothetical protein
VTVTLLPDVEAMTSTFLRAQAEVTALVGQNVYTVTPNDVTTKFPFIRLTRIAGQPLFSQPLVVDQARIQVDCWGGPKKLAWQMAATCMAVLSERFIGTQTGGVVCAVEFGALIDQPDASFDPPQPRWLFDVTITAKPGQP